MICGKTGGRRMPRARSTGKRLIKTKGTRKENNRIKAMMDKEVKERESQDIFVIGTACFLLGLVFGIFGALIIIGGSS